MCASAPPPGGSPSAVPGQSSPTPAQNMRMTVPPGGLAGANAGPAGGPSPAAALSSMQGSMGQQQFNPWQEGGGAAISQQMTQMGMDPTKHTTTGAPIDFGPGSWYAGQAGNSSTIANPARDAAAARALARPTAPLVAPMRTGGIDQLAARGAGLHGMTGGNFDAPVDPRMAVANALIRRR